MCVLLARSLGADTAESVKQRVTRNISCNLGKRVGGNPRFSIGDVRVNLRARRASFSLSFDSKRSEIKV